MQTTLNEIKSFKPCPCGWSRLLSYLDKSKADDEPLDLKTILTSNGIKDAIWCLRCFDYRDYCLFLADLAESVLFVYEKEYDNPAPRNAIKAIRDWHSGSITNEDLRRSATDAYNAASTAYAANAAASAANAANAAYTASSAANASNAAYATSTHVAAIAANDASAYDVYDAVRAKWDEIEELFVSHFGGQAAMNEAAENKQQIESPLDRLVIPGGAGQ